MGWNYTTQWATTLPLELTVGALTIGYWDQTTSSGVWIAVLLLLIVVVNVFGVLGYAEEEFWLACFKVTSITVFLIASLVLVLAGGPPEGLYSEYWGARFWYDPGAFKNGFKGFCSVFVIGVLFVYVVQERKLSGAYSYFYVLWH